MSQQPINIHRSLAGLVVGNIVAIFASGLVCILVWQNAFPDFYQQLRQHIRDVKDSRREKSNDEKTESDKDKKTTDEKTADERNTKEANKTKDGKQDKEQVEKQEKKITPLPEFKFLIWVTTLFVDVFFAGLAGFLCVTIAGFARNNHAILMSLLIVVWKFQQLVGFVENQVPPSLVLAEVIGLPIACMVGATIFSPSDESSSEDEFGGTDPSHQEEEI